MKFIVTNFFERQFNKIVKDIKIKELISKIKIDSKDFINMKTPFVKVKIKTNSKTYRLIIAFDKWDLIVLFINIFDKKDKKFWENITWNLNKNDILNWKKQNEKCIKSWEYYIINQN